MKGLITVELRGPNLIASKPSIMCGLMQWITKHFREQYKWKMV